MKNKKESVKQDEGEIKFLQEQGVDLTELKKEVKAVRKRLKRLGR